jgi:glycosyltransferase involved in cell wall biosynthesis
MEKKRVCIFCETWESGGIESFLHSVLQHLDYDKLRVDIVTACQKKSIFTESLQNLGVRFYELSGSQHNLSENHRKFRRLLKENRYDVIHLNIFQGVSLYYAQLAKQAGVSIRIVHSHNTALRRSSTKPLKLLIHHIAKELFSGAATNLWACSSAAAAFLFPPNLLREKGFMFIPNGIDTEKFRFDPTTRGSVRAELGLQDTFVVGNVGRLCYQKNQDFLLEIFAEIYIQRPDSRLLLIGEGEDRVILEKKAAALGIENAVIFYGVSANVEQLLWAMDAFVFPSRFEGLGIAAVEAQAAGLPCICSEQIPKEARLTDGVLTLALDAGAKVWAKSILEQDCRADRFCGNLAVSKAGFAIQNVACQIQQEYMRASSYGGT